jgi:hypothetical protein
VVRGPFPTGDITRYILLGRIRLDDELSRDRRSWSPAGTLTGLLPPGMLDICSWEDYQRYIEARMQADERRGERRCAACENPARAGERRVTPDRRRADGHNLNVSRVYGRHAGQRYGDTRSRRARTLLLTLVLASLVFFWLLPAAR